MNKRESVNKYSYIVSVIVLGAFSLRYFILIDNLKTVVMNVLLIDESDVLRCSIISLNNLNIVFLNLASLVFNSFILISNGILEEEIPFIICKRIVVEGFKLRTQVSNKVSLCMYLQIFVALFLEHSDKVLL